jgi:adenylate cyclase
MIWGITFASELLVYVLWSELLVAFENSDRYLAAAVVTGIAVLVNASVSILPASRMFCRAHQWAAGWEVDRVEALADTYAWSRAARSRAIAFLPVWTALFTVSIGAVAGATGWRLAQYGILGAALGIAMALLGMHTSVQGAMRPVRSALAADTGIGDELPRSQPTFAAWLNVAMLGSLFGFTVIGAMLGIVWDAAGKFPVHVLFGCVAIGLGWPITVSGIVSPSLRPVRDLAIGTERVAAGDYVQRLPVVQDDDLGALAASFNRMQTGLAERQRLQAAFGTYVDPILAGRLLEQLGSVLFHQPGEPIPCRSPHSQQPRICLPARAA